MKNRQDLKKEYGYILRWYDSEVGEGIINTMTYFLESETDRIEITLKEALDYIAKTTAPRFRDDSIYEAHIGLFQIMGIEPKMTFADLLEIKGLSGYRLAKLSDVPQSAIASWVSGARDFLKCELSTGLKIAKALGMTVEEIEKILR